MTTQGRRREQTKKVYEGKMKKSITGNHTLQNKWSSQGLETTRDYSEI